MSRLRIFLAGNYASILLGIGLFLMVLAVLFLVQDLTSSKFIYVDF